MSAITKFVAKAGAAKAAAEDDYETAGAKIINFLDDIEAAGGSPAERLGKMQALVDAIEGLDPNSPTAAIGRFSGHNADEVNLLATEAATNLPALSHAESVSRQRFAVMMLRGDLEVTNGGELKAVADANAAIIQSRRDVDEAVRAKAEAETKLGTLEAILRRTKSAVTKSLGNEVIKDKAVIDEIKAL